jgi:hypothetical protein
MVSQNPINRLPEPKLQDYIDINGITPDEVLDHYSIIPANLSRLSMGLPYRLITKLDKFAEIPARYRHHLTLKFYHSPSDRNLDNPAVSYTLSLPKVNSQRLSVLYEPATDTDAEALAKLQASGTDSLPVYLFQVKPVIKLDNTVLATGTPIGMGQPQYWTLYRLNYK